MSVTVYETSKNSYFIKQNNDYLGTINGNYVFFESLPDILKSLHKLRVNKMPILNSYIAQNYESVKEIITIDKLEDLKSLPKIYPELFIWAYTFIKLKMGPILQLDVV